MIIAIKSELDSRVVLYPLMKVLKSYGSVLVVSSNRQLDRLYDEVEGGFRNIRIIVEESGATDDIFEEYGIAKGDFDFVVLDNVGAIDYDVHIIPLGAKHSEAFDEEVKFLLSEEAVRTKLIQFGKPVKRSSEKGNREEKSYSKKRKIELEEEYDPAAKFSESEKAKKRAKNSNEKPVMVPFPSYQSIETVEGEHKFYEIPTNLITVFYDILKDTLVVDKNQFRKEVSKRDESSGYIKSRNSTREK